MAEDDRSNCELTPYLLNHMSDVQWRTIAPFISHFCLTSLVIYACRMQQESPVQNVISWTIFTFFFFQIQQRNKTTFATAKTPAKWQSIPRYGIKVDDPRSDLSGRNAATHNARWNRPTSFTTNFSFRQNGI